MKAKNIKIVQNLKIRLKNIFPDLDKIYFFGSQLYSSLVASDFDVLLIFNREVDWKFEDTVLDVVYKESLEKDVVFDVKIYSKTLFESSLYQSMPFISHVLQTGRVI